MNEDKRTESKTGAEGKDGRRPFSRRKADPFAVDKTLHLDYKSLKVMQRFITETGRIVPRRVSGVSAKNQRALTRHIKRARSLGLLSAVGGE